MYLVNALAFEAKWEDPYKWEDQVRTAVFTTGNGEEREITMMCGEEDLYLSDENAQGFMKLCEGGRFAFAVLLPDEGMTVEEHLDTLTGEKLHDLLAGAEETGVWTGIPKLTVESECDLRDALSALGMPTAFDPSRADLTGIGYSDNGSLYISRVLHKTLLEVAEEGTRAAAVTAVETKDESGSVYDHEVILDRPFICMIVDTEACVPLFLAAVGDI